MTHTELDSTDMEGITEALTTRLMAQYGTVLGSNALIKELGYPSAASFQQALARKALPVTVFKLPHRRGSFALTVEVAKWLSYERTLAKTAK